jgi:hypothetical protein
VVTLTFCLLVAAVAVAHRTATTHKDLLVAVVALAVICISKTFIFLLVRGR